jgi:hypothetical protein
MERFTISLNESLATEYGVRHSQINLVPVDMEGGHQYIHSHLKTWWCLDAR